MRRGRGQRRYSEIYKERERERKEEKEKEREKDLKTDRQLDKYYQSIVVSELPFFLNCEQCGQIVCLVNPT